MIPVTAAILLHEGRVLIAQRRSEDPLAYQWEFPGGKREADETPEAALRRELREEFGIEISVGELFGENRWRYPHADVHLMAYRANWTGGELEATAHQEYRWVAIEELRHYDFAEADRPLAEKLRREAASAGASPRDVEPAPEAGERPETLDIDDELPR